MKRKGHVGVPIDLSDAINFFTLYLPMETEISSASLMDDNGDNFLLVYYTANEDNSNAIYKEFHFEIKRYTSPKTIDSKDNLSIHLCSIQEGLYTYGVFYTP